MARELVEKIRFKCNSCGFSQIFLTNDRPKQCPVCDRKTFTIQYGIQERGSCEDHPRWSEAMGCLPEEIPIFQKLYPGSEYNLETGALKVYNRQHKIKEMKRRGFSEF